MFLKLFKKKKKNWKIVNILRFMKWQRLNLILNHHYPIGLVNFQKSLNEEFAYLHGECGRSKCQEKVHLYQLSTIQNSINMVQFNFIQFLISLQIIKKLKKKNFFLINLNILDEFFENINFIFQISEII